MGKVGEERRLIVVNKERKPVLATPIGDLKVRDLEWAGDQAVLLTRSVTSSLGIGFIADKAELWGTLVVPVDGSKPWSILANRKDVTGGIRRNYGISQRDGHWYGYFSAITLDRTAGAAMRDLITTQPKLYEIDLTTGKSSMIGDRTPNEEGWRSWLVGPDGVVGATFDYSNQSGDWKLRRGTKEIIGKGRNVLGEVSLISFGPKGDSVVYYEADTDDGEEHWHELPLAGGQPSEILNDINMSRGIFDARSRRLIGYELEGDHPDYHFFDPYQQKVMKAVLKAFPGLRVELKDWNDSFTRLIVQTDGPGDPGTWHIVDIKSGTANILGTSYPMKAEDVGPMKMIRYKAQDGMDIEAVLTLPPGREAKNLPVVIFPHGGPHTRDYPGFERWAQAMASRGYAVLQPNFRGSTGYGTAFERAGDGQWGLAMQTDISDGLAYLGEQGIVDPKRACIMGASYGGYAALAGVTLQQGLYRCAVSVAGIGNLMKMTLTEMRESGGNQTLKRGLKKEIGSGRDLNAVSPVRFADRADAPVLLIHGKDDTVVLYGQSKDMAGALQRTGKPVEFVTLDGEDHWLSRSETRQAMLKATVAFIEKYNPPDPVASK